MEISYNFIPFPYHCWPLIVSTWQGGVENYLMTLSEKIHKQNAYITYQTLLLLILLH